jgi:hypothetical protein
LFKLCNCSSKISLTFRSKFVCLINNSLKCNNSLTASTSPFLSTAHCGRRKWQTSWGFIPGRGNMRRVVKNVFFSILVGKFYWGGYLFAVKTNISVQKHANICWHLLCFCQIHNSAHTCFTAVLCFFWLPTFFMS